MVKFILNIKYIQNLINFNDVIYHIIPNKYIYLQINNLVMIKRVIHIADIHIPNSNENRPYTKMIHKFIEDICLTIQNLHEQEQIEKNEIRIVIVGDTFHQKIKTSNESQTLFHEMLNSLNDIAKTIIIAGNHDMLENNTDRIDSITPTFEIDNIYENIIYADRYLNYKSGCIDDENVVWAVYSMFDKFNKPSCIDNLKDKNKTIIGLYHGDVTGAITDTGKKMDSKINVDDFIGCNCVMAGHIHRFQTIIKNKIPIVYASSVFQQNIGENTTNHGYVIWNIENMEYKFHEVPNDYKIYKFEITSYDDVKNNKEKLINL